MNQEFSARFAEQMERVARNHQLGEFLPPIGHYEVLAGSLATTQVKHQLVLPNRFDECFEPLPIELPFAKNPRSHDHMRRARLEERSCVVGVAPPPAGRPPGNAPRAARAACSLPGPSMITCPPRRLSRL